MTIEKSKNIYFLTFLLLTISYFSYPLHKEAVQNTASLFVIKNTDSLTLKYKKAKNKYEKKQFDKSLQIALEILRNDKLDKELEFKSNFLIASIFYDTHDLQNAIKYYNRVIRSYENENTFTTVENVMQQKAQLNSGFDELFLRSLLNKGTAFFKFSYQPKNDSYRDSAFYYFNKVIETDFNGEDYQLIRAKAYGNLSSVFISDSLYDKAKKYSLEVVEIYKKIGNKTDQAIALANLSSIHLLEGDFMKAKKIYFNAIDLIKDIRTEEALKVREDLYYNLAYNLYLLKDFKAYDYQELSYNIKDSIQEKQFRKIISKINAEYNFENKRDSFLKAQENKRLKAQRKFWIAGSVLFLMILSLLYFVNYYKLKQKNLNLQLAQTELIQSKKLEKLKSDSQTRILNATIDGKESERKKIAETLHDSVSALLSSANLHLQATKTTFNGKTPIEIDKTREIITEASAKIRDLSHNLVSSVLLKFGLKFAIKDMAKKYSNSQIEITTDIGTVRRYQQDFEIKIHNITQEFLNNILKHSKATQAKIELEERDKILFLKVSDNGKGFNKSKVTNKDGLGINQIRARIIVMKGKFVIDSAIGKGTIISVEIPVQEKEVKDFA